MILNAGEDRIQGWIPGDLQEDQEEAFKSIAYEQLDKMHNVFCR